METVDELSRLAVGQRMRELREAHGLTLDALSNLAGSSLSYVSDCERGTRWPSIPWLVRWAAALDLTVAEAFDGIWPIGSRERPNGVRRVEDGRRRRGSG